MISPSRPERSDVPPTPGLKVRRSEALEEARRRSRPRDISSGAGTLGPFWEQKKGVFRQSRGGRTVIEMEREYEKEKENKGNMTGSYFKKDSVTRLGCTDPHLHFTSSVTPVPVITAVSLLQSTLNPLYLFSISLCHFFFVPPCTH